jgi:LacI family transcriptional regulator
MGSTPNQTVGAEGSAPARNLVHHLLGLGHRRIGFVNYARPEYLSVNQRESGWRQALAEAGVAVDPAWVAYADISADSGWRATRELLARSTGFSALFAGNDTIAFGALHALHEAGLRVPQDIAVVGYDDIPLAAFASPPLTTVRTDPVGQGRQAVGQLLAQLRAGEAVDIAAAEPPTLIVRQSCGAREAPSQPGGSA